MFARVSLTSIVTGYIAIENMGISTCTQYKKLDSITG
jgi:hypothetical protein